MNKIVLEAAAKLNLSLDITGIRQDGYHLLDSVMQSISLYDRVALVKKDFGITLDVDNPKIPKDSKNTAYKSAEAFFEDTGISGGVDIFIEKSIPSEAGMGGGSADAAAVILGLNELYETKLSVEKLKEIGLKVGADVPFCIVGGTARVRGIGEVVEPLPSLISPRFVVAMPKDKGISTKEAYKRYDKTGVLKRPDTEKLLKELKDDKIPVFSEYMYNVLEEIAFLNEIKEIKEELLNYGAVNAMMTGSGAAVFGIFESLILAMATRGRIARKYNAYLTEAVPFGVRVIFKQ